MDQNTSSTPSGSNNKLVFITIGIVLFIFLNIVGIYFGVKYFSGTKATAETDSSGNTQDVVALSGTIGINGAPASGSTVSISVRQSGEKSFTTVITDIAAVDGAVWNWDDAEDGVAYEVQATVMSNGQQAGTSPILTAVAPASNEALEVNLNGGPTPSVSGTPSAISGSFNLNGYIPANSTITISTRQNGGPFTQVEASLAATDNGSWSWGGAVQNQTYDIQATLVSNGQNVAQSQILTATAPGNNEVLTINSSLTPPAPTSAPISGRLNINGSVQSGATISIGTRVTGSNSAFNMVSTNISPINFLSWSWNGGQAGTSYDIQAYLIVNGNVVSTSPTLTVAAPASGETLSINAQNQPTVPPQNALLATCTSKGSNNQWQVRFTINNNSVVGNAQQYQLTAGTSAGNNSLVNVTVDPQSSGQAQDYSSSATFNEGQTYFAQWAYATCANCGTFSPVSSSISFSCVTPSNTPVPSSTSAPTSTTAPSSVPPTAVPTNTPVPTAVPPTNAPTATTAPTSVPVSSPTPTVPAVTTSP